MSRFWFLLALLFSGDALAEAQDNRRALVTWSERQGELSLIQGAYYDGEAWCQLETPLHQDEDIVTTPVIALREQRQVLLAWTRQDDSGMEILWKRGVFTPSSDCPQIRFNQPARKLPSAGRYNIGAEFLVDNRGQLWAFWSSSTNAPSDIFYSRFSGENWSTPRRLHAQNQVPDRDVRATALPDGSIEVTWLSFDMDSGQSIVVTEILDPEKQRESSRKTAPLEQTDQTLPLPSFVPQNQSVKAFVFEVPASE